MGSSHKRFILFALMASLVVAQENFSHPRIICTLNTVKIIKMIKPKWPPGVTASSMVTVEVAIDKTGKPSSIRVLKGNPLFIPVVLEAVKQWRWQPPRINGKTVETVSSIVVNFEAR